MQEEVNERVVLVIKGGVTLTARALAKAMRKVLELRKNKNFPSHQKTGKQNIKQLIGQNAGVSNIELTNSNIKSFDRTARKYGIDYAVKKDRLSTPPKYLVFFKSRDADAIKCLSSLSGILQGTLKQSVSIIFRSGYTLS